MTDTYKLMFRGEVLDGQHPAVVRKRLAQQAGFGDDALDKLFSGRPVVLKRVADPATAARLQGLFRQAGARLRVLPADDAAAAPAAATRPASGGRAEPATGGRPAESSAGRAFEVLPAGSALLRDSERTPVQPRQVDTNALRLAEAGAISTAPESPAPAPDVSHLSMADVGSRLGPPERNAEPAADAPEFDLAEAGADLGPRRSPVTPPIDPARLSFDLAPPGSPLAPGKVEAPPEPPDTSHLSLTGERDH